MHTSTPLVDSERRVGEAAGSMKRLSVRPSVPPSWASTPLEYWGVERRRRENRGAVGGEGDGVWGEAVSITRKFMNFSS